MRVSFVCAALISTVSVTNGVCAETSTEDYDFQMVCDWQEATLTERARFSGSQKSVSLATSPKPEQLEVNTGGVTVEIPGIAGVRQFVTRALPGLLAGEMLTVFPDGRGIRTQTYDIDGELSVSTKIGTCEVIE